MDTATAFVGRHPVERRGARRGGRLALYTLRFPGEGGRGPQAQAPVVVPTPRNACGVVAERRHIRCRPLRLAPELVAREGAAKAQVEAHPIPAARTVASAACQCGDGGVLEHAHSAVVQNPAEHPLATGAGAVASVA
eukprot:5033840-Prymnesium_polylepis.1